MIDNYALLVPLLKFESEDDFYYLQILQRKKENTEVGKNSNSVREFYIGNLEYLERKWSLIKALCEVFNARACLRMNRRSWRQCALRSMEKIAGQIVCNDFRSVAKYYSRVAGTYHNETPARWIVDLDENNLVLIHEIAEYINTLRPEGNKILATVPSKNGWHLLTNPFDVQEFNKKGYKVELHKDNPENLYIP